MKIRAAVLYDFHQQMKIEELEQIEPRANEIRVKMISCGICQTENAYRNKVWNTPLKMPIILGHEGAGIVEKTGPGVTKFREGDKVALTTPYCGYCEACRNGRTWYCEKLVELQTGGFDYYGTTPVSRNGSPVHILFNQSSLQDHAVLHINNAVKLPEDFDLRIAGPLGCGLRTGAGTVYNCLRPRVGEWVVIFGTGFVGLAAMWMAKAMGARTVMVDVLQSRLDEALRLGADYAVCTKDLEDWREAAAEIRALRGGRGMDYAVEGTGVPFCHKAAMLSMKIGGHCAQVANINAISYDNFSKDCNDGRQLTFVRMGNVDGEIIIPVMADMLQRGLFPYEELLTFYPFDRVNDALVDMQERRVFKPVILFD